MSAINLLRKKVPGHINVKALHKLFDALILNANPFRIQTDPHCCYTAEDIMQLVAHASLERQTIESSCTLLSGGRGFPHPSTVRNALSHHPPATIDALVNDYLAITLKKLTRFSSSSNKKAVTVIVDFHEDAYYGRDESPYIVTGNPSKGTNRFYSYATICMPENGLLYTLAMKSVTTQATRVEIMKYLIERAKTLVNVKQVLADGAFYNVDVARYLDQEGITFIVRGVRNEGIKSHIRRYKNDLKQEGSYKRVPYLMKSHGNKRSYPVNLILYRQQNEIRVLLVNKMCPLRSPRCIKLYGRRFSIETPYRMKHYVKGWTTSKKAAIRSVLFGMSCLLYMVWIIYRHVVTNATHAHDSEEKSGKVAYEQRMGVLLTRIRLRLAPRLLQEGSTL